MRKMETPKLLKATPHINQMVESLLDIDVSVSQACRYVDIVGNALKMIRRC